MELMMCLSAGWWQICGALRFRPATVDGAALIYFLILLLPLMILFQKQEAQDFRCKEGARWRSKGLFFGRVSSSTWGQHWAAELGVLTLLLCNSIYTTSGEWQMTKFLVVNLLCICRALSHFSSSQHLLLKNGFLTKCSHVIFLHP